MITTLREKVRKSHSWNENRVLKNKIIRDLRNEHVVFKINFNNNKQLDFMQNGHR